jgi:chromosomal replication initiation ATPase DnaA
MQLTNTPGDAPPQETRQRDVMRVASTPRHLRMAIVAGIAADNGVTVADIMSRSRKRHLAWPRQEAMAAIRDVFPDDSLPQIGRLFGRDHTTVLHAVRQVKARGL